MLLPKSVYEVVPVCGEPGQTTDYRAFFLDDNGHVFTSEVIVAENDEEAILRATRLRDGHDISARPRGGADQGPKVRPSQAVGLSFIRLGGSVRNFAIGIHDLFRLVDCIRQFAQGPCLSDLPMLQRNDFHLRPVRISPHNQFASYRPKAVGEPVIEYPADGNVCGRCVLV
jgi:hypothetical protein